MFFKVFQKKSFLTAFLIIIYSALLFTSVRAEKLPLKHFTIADGLPQNSINFISQDRKGFFWIGTKGGLSRFDGYEFVNFAQQEGLPKNEVLDFLETRAGDFWLATGGGLVNFNPDGKAYDHIVTKEESLRLDAAPLFTIYSLSSLRVSKIIEDSRGTIWVGTSEGLFKSQKNGDQLDFLPFDIHLPANESKQIYLIYEDRKGAIWTGTESTLTRISPDNHLTNYHSDEKISFRTMVEDRSQNLWVGTYLGGLFQFAIDENETPKIVRKFSNQPETEAGSLDKIIESSSGKLWLGGLNGLYEFDPDANKLLRYTRTSGINPYRFYTMLEDRAGNLWLGTTTNGIYRLSTDGLISFGAEHQISFVRSVGLDNENNLLLTGFTTNSELDEKGAKVSRNFSDKATQPFEWKLGKLDENGFSWIFPHFSKPVKGFGWGIGQLSFQGKNGEWWIATDNGLFHFPKVKFEDLRTSPPINVFNETNGLTNPKVFNLFEDSKENVWISTYEDEKPGLYKWERATEKLHNLSLETNLSEINSSLINSFAEDGEGNIWVGFREQGFARLQNGKFYFYGDGQGIPAGGTANIFFDRENRLWVALRQNGILQIDNPQTEPLNFINYTKDSGLSTNRTLSVTQDQQGLIYIGTDSNINVFNPQTHEFKFLNLASDEPQREYSSAVCDKNGTLWFGTTQGLIKYVPVPDKQIEPPEVLITGVSVQNIPQKVSAIGTTELDLPTLSPNQNQVRINFVSLANLETTAKDISYQYKINADGEWSKPAKENFVNFANLSAGNYQIYFRAVFSDKDFNEKNVSANPAVLKFRLLPPIYLRWWFITLGMLLVLGIIYAFYRLKLQRLLEIERTRTLIATDLHDDIGSNLSKISVLSEVVRMQLENKDTKNNKLLDSIANISRESVGSMSDIVWAINPKRDSALEMVRKMREHAEEIFVPKNVQVKFSEPAKSAKIKLPMDLRRDLYLIFKESINNVSKHSNCTTVKIDFDIHHHEIILQIEDDGIGFDCTEQANGNGLANMQKRVEKLKGNFQIESEKSFGTTVKVRIPQS